MPFNMFKIAFLQPILALPSELKRMPFELFVFLRIKNKNR